MTSNSDNAIHKAFTKSEIRKYNDHYKSNFNINTAASKFAKEILQDLDEKNFADILKGAKEGVKKHDNIEATKFANFIA